MSKYYLFSGDDYYPLEGVRDLAGKFETIEQAKLAANIDANWHQITNVELEILWSGYNGWADKIDWTEGPS